MISKVKQFLTEVNALQEEYGLYIIAQEEMELLVSLGRDETPNNVVCYTGDTTLGGSYKENAIFIEDNIERMSND
jgi:hypothetical protein